MTTERLRLRLLGRHVAVLVDLDRQKAEAQAAFTAAWDAAPEAARDEFARLALLGDQHAAPEDGMSL